MTNSLIEKMAKDECRRYYTAYDDCIPRGKTIDDMVEKEWRDYVDDVKAQIAKVLDHFSDQANVTDKMAKAVCDEGADNYWRERIAAAMKTAKEELK